MENFIITIGRQAGSGGREIGMRLAQRLGIPYYGRQELMEIAKGTPDYEEVQSFYEEQPVDDLLYAIATSNVEEDLGHIPFRRILQLCSKTSKQTVTARLFTDTTLERNGEPQLTTTSAWTAGS